MITTGAEWWEEYVYYLHYLNKYSNRPEKVFDPLETFDVSLAMSILSELPADAPGHVSRDHGRDFSELIKSSLFPFVDKVPPHLEGPISLSLYQENEIDKVLPLISNFPKSFIAGGWVRDLLLGEEPNDIDVWSVFLDWEEQIKGIENPKTQPNVFSFESDNNFVGDKVRYPDFIQGVKTDLKHSPKVQFICVDNPIGYMRTFDFSINMLLLNSRGEVFTLHENTLEDLKSRTLTRNPFVLNPYSGRMGERTEKFTKRGFRWSKLSPY